MRVFFAPLVALIGIAVVAAAIAYLAWDLDWRWRPHTLAKDQGAIATALAQSGWVSPHLPGPKVYVIVPGPCPTCQLLETRLIAPLQAKGVDTRMIVVAPADENGRPMSTAQDRAVVAELWANRSWQLFQRWTAPVPDKPSPHPAPQAPLPPLPAADGDAGRTAIVEAGRTLVSNLTPWLKDSGVRFAYPTLIWWAKDGRMRACVCTNPKAFVPVERELDDAATAAHQGNSLPS